MTARTEPDLEALAAARERLRQDHLGSGRASTGRGIHHTALLCTDPAVTTRFYSEVLGFPLTEVLENRDYPGSTHFFFDAGHGNQIAFFDLPGLDLPDYAEVLGGLHHCCISVSPEAWDGIRERLLASGVEVMEESETSLYFRDPDGARLEVIAEPLGQMYGNTFLAPED